MTFEKLAKISSGLSASDLSNLVNQAALHAALKSKIKVDDYDFMFAFDRIKMGPQKVNKVQVQEVLWKTAIHEAGHALTAHYTKGSMPINKITILARGSSLGHVILLTIFL